MTIRLLIVDDDPLVRAGLTFMLGGAEDIEIVGEGTDGAEVPELVERLVPDVVLMDIRMPRVDGLTATERLRARPGAPEVVVLTTFHADDQVLRALRAGAAGFVLKDTPPAEIVASVRRVAAGDPVLSPAVTRQLMTHVAGQPERSEQPEQVRRTAAARRLAELAEREREVALAVGRGGSNAEIAAALYMSVPTVKTHVSRILAKLGLNNRVQIALLVHDAGLSEDGLSGDEDGV
ncbi:response regulator transcription factor [Streptomyces sp. HUAS YS2]|uniref:Response regulator transcription factor n=2 Tax=Streptomyces solicathayae TaxID=3081768 RepID=A0ABZ0LPQ6_9ACTN|nr:response regulator transcription factor [Streptomyces sp. HUAS YS2]WOX21201.1 response regulator transcription factor [Streptomyces sp. HUAS YS2]